jgi:cob(I)alamin adenosyltransferase
MRVAEYALCRAREAMLSRKYDIVIIDEICIAIFFALLKTEDVVFMLEEKPQDVELILTGRYCPPDLIEKADLVTEMQEIKHNHRQGVIARKDVES